MGISYKATGLSQFSLERLYNYEYQKLEYSPEETKDFSIYTLNYPYKILRHFCALAKWRFFIKLENLISEGSWMRSLAGFWDRTFLRNWISLLPSCLQWLYHTLLIKLYRTYNRRWYIDCRSFDRIYMSKSSQEINFHHNNGNKWSIHFPHKPYSMIPRKNNKTSFDLPGRSFRSQHKKFSLPFSISYLFR